MADTHQSGPGVAYGFNPQTGGDYNPDAGPNTSYQGDCFMDVRFPYQGGSGPITSGNVSRATFFNSQTLRCVDTVPATLTAAAIAVAAAPASGTAYTLVSASGAGITVTTASAAVAGYPMMGSAPGLKATALATPSQALLAIDSLFAYLTVGRNAILDPTVASARAVSLTSSATLAGINFTVRGYDIYGYKVTETIAGPSSATTVNGKKAFKYIQSITPNGTSANTASFGLSDIYGIHLRNLLWEELLPFWNQAFVTSTTGWTVADTTSPATATTGDVRGTYAVQGVASNGVRRLALNVTPSLANIVNATPSNATSLFGVAQFSDF